MPLTAVGDQAFSYKIVHEGVKEILFGLFTTAKYMLEMSRVEDEEEGDDGDPASNDWTETFRGCGS